MNAYLCKPVPLGGPDGLNEVTTSPASIAFNVKSAPGTLMTSQCSQDLEKNPSDILSGADHCGTFFYEPTRLLS